MTCLQPPENFSYRTVAWEALLSIRALISQIGTWRGYNGQNSILQNSCLPETSECVLIWKYGLCRCNWLRWDCDSWFRVSNWLHHGVPRYLVKRQSACFYKGVFFIFLICHWMIIALQRCIGFCNTSAWISHKYTCLSSLWKLPSTSHPIPPL